MRALWAVVLVGCASSNAEDATDAAVAPPLTSLELRYTEYLGQLTGTARNPVRPLGMSGTDLGVAFERDGQLAFLFGDAWLDDRDSMALAPPALPADGTLPQLRWVTAPGGGFEPFVVPGVALGGMNVPLDAVPSGDRTYYFFSAGYSFETGRYAESVLAHGTGLDPRGLVLDHRVATDRFINVSVVVDGDTAWIFGSGPYRASDVFLAHVPVAQLADRSAWIEEPEPLVRAGCVGELSARRDPFSGLWLLAYNCGGPPRGIHLRTATAPTGPWSEPHLIYTPELGYQHFIHARESAVGFDDGLADAGREDEWGGEYGPYLVPRWFSSPAPGVVQLVYTMSSWNPYQTHLMRTTMAAPGVPFAPPPRGSGVPPTQIINGDFAAGDTRGWTSSGDSFAVFQQPGGGWRVSTFGAAGDATRGELWQDLVLDGEVGELRFKLHGGDARVELRAGGEVVRRSHGRRDNERELAVRWQLRDLRGQTVRLVIVDDLAGAWGFVGAGDFVIE